MLQTGGWKPYCTPVWEWGAQPTDMCAHVLAKLAALTNGAV